MAKLDMGILAILGLGVGAFVLSKTAKGDDDIKPPTTITQKCPPNFHKENGICIPNNAQPLPPTIIIPTDSPITTGTGQTGIFSGIETPVVLPTQIEPTEPSIETPPPVEQIPTIIDEVFGGEISPNEAEPQVTAITKLNGTITVFGFTGQINIDETISFQADHRALGFRGNEVITYNWDFGDGKTLRGTDLKTVTHIFRNPNQYKITCLIESSLGSTSKPSKTINVIPIPLSYGAISLSLTNSQDRLIITMKNNRKSLINGSLSVNASNNNTFTKSYSVSVNGNSSVQHIIDNLNSGNTTFNISFRVSGRQLDNIVKTLNIQSVSTPTPTSPNVPAPTPSTSTQIFEDEVKHNSFEKHPTALTSTYSLLGDYALPTKAKKIKYARIYFKAKADSFGLAGAKAVIKFNGSVVGTVSWSAFEDRKEKSGDFVVTNKMKLRGNNKTQVTYTHNNVAGWIPLASGFIVTNANLYVKYEY